MWFKDIEKILKEKCRGIVEDLEPRMGKVGNTEWEQGEGALSGWEVEGSGTSLGEYWASDVQGGMKKGV